MPPPAQARRSRRSRPAAAAGNDDEEDGMQSDGSMPSLQTVSDSSEDDYLSDDSDFYESEDDDQVAFGEDNSDGIPRLIPANEGPQPIRSPQPRPQPATTAPQDHVHIPDQFYMYEDSEDEDAEVGESIPPVPGNVGASLLGTLVALDRMNRHSPFHNMQPLLRSLMANSPPIHLFHHATAHPDRPDKDLQRAETIIEALEKVPKELIGRYEKLRAGNGQDDCDGCPICRESLLEDSSFSDPDESALTFLVELPFRDIPDTTIVAFPCPGKHLFHDTCLSPWLSRKTTCPSCRFDVDPHSLTLRPDPSRPSQHSQVRPRWAPPQSQSFLAWLEDEEFKALNPTQKPLPSFPASSPAPSSSRTATPTSSLHSPSLQRMAEVLDDDGDESWTTDDEAVPSHPQAHPPSAALRSEETGRRPVLGNLDDPSHVAERRRFLRSLLDPNNPLQLFMGDEESDFPTLIPQREPHWVMDEYEGDDADEGPPPLMDNDITLLNRGRHASNEDRLEEEDDELPLLVGEPERPARATNPYDDYLPPWFTPNPQFNPQFNPALSFARLNELARAFATRRSDG
ncbi:hypothetical protein BXZ70DRAFT_490642 [Cristinia sonorae]|uniref:RING-type domain-containing protein n=1 Tax=Cristinia sonorae TaxID=1940300 RepID=A0A8K0UHM3_9AGAR|nr:hypothetical protein BXZ70DRAFT_490642 [Cristinia sonorae]